MDKMILKRLMNDHKHIAVLLDVLAKKITNFPKVKRLTFR